MNVIGLCGGSGSGKSVVSSFFASHGIPVFDCDAAYHALVSAPTPCVAELAEAFGQEILLPSGALDRARLAQIVFAPGAKDKLELLDHITHTYVKAAFDNWCRERERENCQAVVLDAPLLFEAGMDLICSITVAVVCPREIRIRRITERDGIDAQSAEKRIDAQRSDEELCRLCDYTVVNAGTMEEINIQLADLLHQITERGILK